jgi:lipopolysaccharide export system permease protein
VERHYGKAIDEKVIILHPMLYLKTIDKYIIRKFLGTFFFSIFLLLFIVVIFDISEKIDDFLKHDAPLKAIIFNYYLNFIPYFINLFSYLFTFISVIFFTSRMASNSEIIAILSSGISFRRMLVPYFLSAGVLALMSFILANFIIPHTNKGMLAFERQYVNDPKEFHEQNIHKQISPGTYIYLENFNPKIQSGWRFSLEQFRGRELVLKIVGQRASYDSVRSVWSIENYYSRRINGDRESMTKGAKLDTVLPLNPKDFLEDIEDVKVMNYFFLHRHIATKELRGDPDIVKFKVKMYERFAFPFAAIILTLIGVSVSSRKVRGGMGFNLGFGLAPTFIYILFMQIFTVFATFGNFPPLLAVWVPNIIFGFIAVFLARTTPK